jgi:hypothetical protein
MDRDLIISAYHEAGHVLMAHLFGGEVQETTLETEREGHQGLTAVVWRGQDEAGRLRCSAMVALAGPVAETLWRGEEILAEDLETWRADWEEVDAGLAALAQPHEREALRRKWLAEVAGELQDPDTWERLCRIADALQAHETLDRGLLDELLY